MRTLFYTILTTIGLCLSAVILVPSFFDLNNYKTKLYKLVESQTGYNLEIKGPVKISIFPKLSFNADDITLINRKEVLFKANKINIYPSIYSLLRGNIAFNGIRLESAEIFIKKYKNKTYNWNTKKIASKTREEKSFDDKKSTIDKKNNNFLIVRNLYLSNSAIEYQDVNVKHNLEKIAINFRQNSNKNFQFDGGFYLNDKEHIFKYKAQISKMNVNIKGKLNSEYYNFENSGEYNIDLNKGDLSINGYLKNLKSLTKIDDLKINELYLSSKLSFKKNSIDFNDLKITANDNNIYGNANVEINNKKSNVTLFLNSDYINLNKIYSSKSNTKNVSGVIENEEKDNNKKEKIINKNIFEVLKNIDITSILSAKEIFYKNINLENTQLKVNKKNNIEINLKANNFFKSKLASKFILNKKMEYSFSNTLNGFSLLELNDFYKVNLVHGYLDLESNLKGVIKNSNKLFPFREVLVNSNGVSSLKAEGIVIKNLNLNNFKEKISNLSSISQITELKKSVFKGDTKLGNQEIKLLHKKETLNLPLTKLNVDDEIIGISGKYNINNKNIELVSNFDSKNSFLSLFSIKTKGKISDLTNTISFDEKAVSGVIKKLAEKKLKKSLEKKLEKKFDNLIDNLLEEL